MIGVFGGTFDPVHFGHLRSALEIGELFNLSEVRLIPCSVPPHRPQPVASAAHRLQMLKLAIGNQSGLIVDARELGRTGHSYMVDTLGSLRADFPGQTLLLVIGCDAFNGLASWHRWRQLFDYAHVVVMTRPGFVSEIQDKHITGRIVAEKEQLQQISAGKLFFQPVTQLDISATAIRAMIAEQRNPGFLLPDAVLNYIRSHKLYQNIDNPQTLEN